MKITSLNLSETLKSLHLHHSFLFYLFRSLDATLSDEPAMSFPLAYTSNPDGPPPSQRPKIDTFAHKSYHSPTHVAQSLPSSSRTSSFKRYSSSDYDQPSHGLPPPKHPRLVTAPSSPLTTLHGPTSTVVLHTAGPHRDPGYESTITAASPSVAPHPPPATTASPCMQRYATYLKDRYTFKKTPVYDKESNLLKYKSKSFINIALVEKESVNPRMTESDKNDMIMDRLHGHVDAIQKRKTKLNFSNVCMCENGDVARSVLVEGAPGVGKTTFAFELCKQWARGKILQEWGVVVIIKLRDRSTRTAQTINDILYHPDPEIHKQVVKELVERNGKGMLLILDGYDELTTEQTESCSVIQRLISRQRLFQATLMVTSRPLATRTLHPEFRESIDQHIEVLGFTDKNIKEYINSACGDNPELVEDINEYLSCHPFSSSLMFNPLQCAIVTDIYCSYWRNGEKGFAPKTLTELYTGLVHTLLLRYLTHHPVHKDRDWRLRDMSDLPEVVKQELKAVTALAAKGIEKQQYVFDEEDDNVPSETLGLMQREEELTAGIGISSSHNFLHLTLQEYLAAVHYSQQCDSPEQLSQILGQNGVIPLCHFLESYGKKGDKFSSSSATHWPAVLFLAGRTRLSGIDLNLLKHGLHDSSVDVSLLHLLYETQCPQLIQSTLVTSGQYMSVNGRSALDWFVIGFCIANSTSTWRIEKKANNALKHFNHLVMGLKLAPQDGSGEGEGKIVSLVFSGSWSGNCKILSQLNPFTKSVTDITLVGPKQDTERNPVSSKGKTNYEKILDCCACPLLNDLCIRNANVNFPYYHYISQQINLHTLSLTRCKLSIETSTSLISSLQSPNCTLLKISLDDCTISSADCSYQFSICTLQNTNGKVSLTATGSCSAINHWLSLLSSYSVQLTESILSITKQETDETLEGIGLFSHMLEILNFNSTCFKFSFPLFFEPCQKNLHTLAMAKCELSSEATSSLIHSLQSPNSRLLNKLSFQDCTFSTPDHTYCFTLFELLETNGKNSLKAEGSSFAINHWLLYIPSYANLMTELNLYVTEQDSSPDETLEGISLNNLHTLSLTKCQLRYETTKSFIHSLQSKHCKLNKLTLQNCTIPSTDSTIPSIDDLSFSEVQHGNFSLSATGSCSEINHWLSLLSSYTKIKLTETILKIKGQDSLSNETLENISLYRDVLEILRIDFWKSFVIPQFVGQQQNNLHTLSLNQCNLSSESTSSLIHSLQSPHCRLHKLVLYDCTIPTTDHTHLTTAIVSSTTITHLFFVDRYIDTPTLTALVSGLKQNRTMEKVVIDNGLYYSAPFTKEQFQLLIEAVDSSAVKKLYLYKYHKKLLNDCPISRDDVVIEWYDDAYDVYKKW